MVHARSALAPVGLVGLVGLAALVALAPTAMAQDFVANDKAAVDKGTKEDGFYPLLRVGAGLSFSSNIATVGQPEGESVTISFKLDAAADYISGPHDWRNSLAVAIATTMTPELPEMLKSADLTTFDSLYMYRALDWVGPFVRFRLDMPLFPGEDVRASEYQYTVVKVDGTTDDIQCGVAKRCELSSPFLPMNLRQSVGAFFEPYSSDPVTITARVGLGAAEFLGDGQLKVSAVDADAGVITLNELQSYVQVGGEAGLSVDGKFLEGKITYGVSAEALMPFYYSLDPDAAFEDTLRIDLGAKIGLRPVEWFSLDYQFKAIQSPVQPEWEIMNVLLATFGYTLIGG